MEYFHKYLKYKHKNKIIIEQNLSNDSDEVPILIIPKNTLLFRVVDDKITDFVGVKIDDKYCIPKEFNVFFYFSPFIVDGLPIWFKDFKNLDIYVVNDDIKVLKLIEDSKYNRSIRAHTNVKIATSCDKIVNSCLKGRQYDVCFTEYMLNKYPDVMGWIGITQNDSKKVINEMKNGALKDKEIKKYVHLMKDNRNVWGPAEVALYPLKNRSSSDLFTNIDQANDFISKNSFNYTHYATVERNKYKIIKFMKKNAKYNPITKFYELKI